MKLTNRLNLPQALYDAVKNDPYTSGGATYSVTTLLKPPRVVALEKEHYQDLEEDASDRIWSLLGQVVHSILERANTVGVSERRLYINVDGVSISGGMDLYHNKVLQDFKLTTLYKFQNNEVPLEFEQQLNIYAEILRQNGHEVERLEIVGILRDWSKSKARQDSNLPQAQVVIRNVNFWYPEDTQKFIAERIKLHQNAAHDLPLCTEEERWARPTKYAVMKIGGKKAVKLYDNLKDASAHASTDKILQVETRPGESLRCELYCSVSKFCSQYQEMIKPKKAEDVA